MRYSLNQSIDEIDYKQIVQYGLAFLFTQSYYNYLSDFYNNDRAFSVHLHIFLLTVDIIPYDD